MEKSERKKKKMGQMSELIEMHRHDYYFCWNSLSIENWIFFSSFTILNNFESHCKLISCFNCVGIVLMCPPLMLSDKRIARG